MKAGENLEIDLERLIETRLLITANSGGGKSWLIRRLLEQTHGQVQQIVIDLEGEFATLREKFDYLLVGRDGEIKADIRSAEILVPKLLELKVSTIIDLSELKHHERIIFVKRFLDSLINVGKELWHPVMVVVDEAHQFCPEGAKSESASSVIDLQTRGRKRGFCGVLATQRISKLHKDAAAECNNKIIGRTGQDIDRKRSGEELGFTSKEQFLSLRDLEPGEVYAFGPAISKEVIKGKIGDVQTTHPKVGGKVLMKPAPTPKNIQKILGKLNNLPQEAEEELRTKKDYENKISQLKRELTMAKSGKNEISKEFMDKIAERTQKTAEKASQDAVNQVTKGYQKLLKDSNTIIVDMWDKLKKAQQILTSITLQQITIPEIKNFSIPPPALLSEVVDMTRKQGMPSVQHSIQEKPKDVQYDRQLTSSAKRMLNSMTLYSGLTKIQLAILNGYKHNSGTFSNYLSELRASYLITELGGKLMLTEEGQKMADWNQKMKSIEDIMLDWRDKLTIQAFKIFAYIVGGHSGCTREEIGSHVDLSHTSGTFSNYLSELRSAGLIATTGDTVSLHSQVTEIVS